MVVAERDTCEIAVMYDRPWFGGGVKRFVATNEWDCGVALGHFMMALVKFKGRVLSIEIQRLDGTTEHINGEQWEEMSSVRRGGQLS